jgi:putative phosphonate transport system ATP-binding protein
MCTNGLSGQARRAAIARALLFNPRIIAADEPTAGLDVSVQARLLDLLRGLVREMGLSAIIVTHDLAVVRLLADRLMVMKGGHVVEQGLTDQVLDDPQHAYTQLLVSSVLQV